MQISAKIDFWEILVSYVVLKIEVKREMLLNISKVSHLKYIVNHSTVNLTLSKNTTKVSIWMFVYTCTYIFMYTHASILKVT